MLDFNDAPKWPDPATGARAGASWQRSEGPLMARFFRQAANAQVPQVPQGAGKAGDAEQRPAAGCASRPRPIFRSPLN
jgi:hypothetical protein